MYIKWKHAPLLQQYLMFWFFYFFFFLPLSCYKDSVQKEQNISSPHETFQALI